MWPQWLAAAVTAKVHQQMAVAGCSLDAAAAGGGAPGRIMEGCLSVLALIARLVELSELQVVQQLAGDVPTATRCVLCSVHARQRCKQPMHCTVLQLLSGPSLSTRLIVELAAFRLWQVNTV